MKQLTDRSPVKWPKGLREHLRDNPDETLLYQLAHCPECGQDLRSVATEEIIRKQEVEIPPLRAYVVEHQIELKKLPLLRDSVAGRWV